MGPNVLVSSATITLWCWLIIILLLLFRFLCRSVRWLFFRLFDNNLRLLLGLFLLLCLFLLFLFLFLFGFLFSLLFKSFSLFLFSSKLIEVSLTWVYNSLFGLLLISKEISSSSQESKNSIKETVNIALLLNDCHKDTIELVFFVHLDFKLFQNFINSINKRQIY